MYKILFLNLTLFITNFVFPQCNGRYDTEIFSSVNVSTINYSDVYNDNAHTMDIYSPDGDTEINRPLILFIHGGTFVDGDKSDSYCVEFCTNFAKKGYVVASPNYRLVSLLNLASFLTSHEEQYEAVLKATADIKSAIRFFRKDFDNGNNYGIDPNTIFVGGSSAGAITAIHLAYIDNISDVPTTPFNIQAIVNNLGGLDGDAGNLGYSSSVNAVISFAGGIHNVNWIDANDEPLVSCHGNLDQTVNYNCGPGLGQATVLELCGSAEMHPQANLVGVLNNTLTFNGEDHSWCSSANSSNFIHALDFTKDFLFPLLPCNNINTISDLNQNKSKLIKITDLLGREVKEKSNNPLLYFYDDGSIKQQMIIK